MGGQCDDLYQQRCAPNGIMAVSHRNFSFLVCRTLFRRGGRRNFPLSRSLCGSSVRYGLQDEVESHNEGGEMLPHGLKGKESRYRRVAQLRKKRHDTDLEKKARTGQCEHSIQPVYTQS